MRQTYNSPEVEFVMFEPDSVIRASDCLIHCDGNCSCHYCVGVCTWDCTSDDSTCTNGDYNE